jgi:MYXO-CTERM domain-containing protein
MAIRSDRRHCHLAAPFAAAVASLLSTFVASAAWALPLRLVTPGEQNTASAEFQCTTTPCPAGKFPYYPEILQMRLGAGYTVVNVGDGGAVLGCDAATATAAGMNSFCKNAKYMTSITPPPDIVIIGPFGEHDQRIVATNAALYNMATFVAAYDALVMDYLKYTMRVYMITPIDLPWNAAALPAGQDLVKDIMLPAAKTVAANHNLTVIDAYTVLTSTPALVTQYYQLDGQLNTAGQQKLADLIMAALASGADGGAAADASSSSGNTSGSASGSGTSSGASTSGSTATSGTNATSGAAASGATAGSGATQGGSGTSGGGSGAAASSGASSGSSTMTSGNGATSGAGPAAGTPVSSSGCACTTSSRAGSGASALLIALGLAALGRRRASRA